MRDRHARTRIPLSPNIVARLAMCRNLRRPAQTRQRIAARQAGAATNNRQTLPAASNTTVRRPGCAIQAHGQCAREATIADHEDHPDLLSHFCPHSEGLEEGTRRRQARASRCTRPPPSLPHHGRPGGHVHGVRRDAGCPDGSTPSRWEPGSCRYPGTIPTPRSPPGRNAPVSS